MYQTKVCTKCNTEKSLKSFHVRANSPDGRRGVCKSCKNAVSRNFYEARRNETRATLNVELKICCTCKIEKNIDNFSKKSDTKDGFMKRCKSCVAEHHQI